MNIGKKVLISNLIWDCSLVSSKFFLEDMMSRFCLIGCWSCRSLLSGSDVVSENKVSQAICSLNPSMLSYPSGYPPHGSSLKSIIVWQVILSKYNVFRGFLFFRLRGKGQPRNDGFMVECQISSSLGYRSRCPCVLWRPSRSSVSCMPFSWPVLTQL